MTTIQQIQMIEFNALNDLKTVALDKTLRLQNLLQQECEDDCEAARICTDLLEEMSQNASDDYALCCENYAKCVTNIVRTCLSSQSNS
jgi:hypothetical protein